MIKALECDRCGREMIRDDAHWDYIDEYDLCGPCARVSEIENLKAERSRLSDWLESTFHKKLRELDAKIRTLESNQ